MYILSEKYSVIKIYTMREKMHLVETGKTLGLPIKKNSVRD